MPASLLTEMSAGLEDQRALQIALELTKLGLNHDNHNDHAANTAVSSSGYENGESGMVKKSANMTECVPVPSSEHVAEIVGRQGCKIKALRAKTNTYIKTPVRGAEPVFVVTGRREDVAAAKREILSAAEHFSQIRASRRNNNTQPSGGSPSMSMVVPGPPSPTSPGQVTIQVRVPYRVVGLVVGPKGATIKRIQQQTHTYIVTPSRDKEPIFEVTGLPENVEKARQEIESHIAARTGGVLDGQLHTLSGGGLSLTNGHDDHIHHHHCADFHSNNFDAVGLRDINDFLGSVYKSPASTNSAFTSYASTATLNDSNNIMSQRSQDTSVFAFPSAINNRSAKLTELTALTNGFNGTHQHQSNTTGFGITYESDEGIGGSPSFDPPALSLASSIWSDAGEGQSMSLFTPISAANGISGRRNSSSNSASLSPPLAETCSSHSPGCGHSSVRRLRSDPVCSQGLGTVSVFAPLPAFSTSSSTSLSCGSISTSPTDSTGSSASSGLAAAQRRCCFVCGDSGVVAALVPCGHNLFCMECANFLMAKPEADRRCPVCHQRPTQAIRIFCN